MSAAGCLAWLAEKAEHSLASKENEAEGILQAIIASFGGKAGPGRNDPRTC